MRDIKFRAWDKATNSMITSDDANGGVRIYLNGSVSIDGVWATKDVELMQYTGLKDKSGVEIYEGDVVYLAGYGAYECEFPFYDLYSGAMENDIGEVLGNIYQNPELLEGE